MPRFAATSEPAAQLRRTFPRPWTFKPGESCFRVIDANGIEVMTVGFTALEMRDSFPNGKTYDEALSLARYLCRTINTQVAPAANEDRRARRP